MAKNKEMYDTAAFPELLSTLSMKEVMEMEFRGVNTNKWLNMVLLKDPQKRLYLCTVCQVVQYSEKNLFSHLFGKKHFQNMGGVNKVRLPKINVQTIQPNKALAKNIAPQPNKAKAKKAAAAAKRANLTKNTQPIPTIPKSNLAKPAAPKNSPNSAVAKNIVAAKNELVTKPNTPTEVAKKVLAPKPNAATETAQKALHPAVETAKKPPNTPIEAANKVLVTKPEILVETAKNDLTVNAVKPAEQKVTAKPSNETQNITQTNTAEGKSTNTTEDNSKNCSNRPKEVAESTNLSDKASEPLKTSSNLPKVIANPSNVPTKTAVPEKASKDKPNTCSNQPKEVGNSSNFVTTTPVPESNTTEDTTKISSNQPKVVAHPSKVSSNVRMEIKTEAATNVSNIVLNPLSKAAKDKKITCVPISKLISKPQVLEDDDDVVMVTPEKPLEKLANKKKRKETERVTENPPNPNPNAFATSIPIVKPINVRPTPLPVVTFESTANASEVLGLLGVEYVLKIVKSIGDTKPRFLCCLCSISTDELAMHNHLLSNNHRLKYCEQHFPTAIRQYKQYISEVPQHQVYKVLTPILNKLAIAIEKHHGRVNDTKLCYEHLFAKNRENLIASVFNRRHASEASGPSFTHVIDSKEMDVLIENATRKVDQSNNPNATTMPPYNSFYPSSYGNHIVNTNYFHNIETVDDETHKRMVDNFLRDTRVPEPNRHRGSSRATKRAERNRSKSPDRKRQRTNPITITQWNIERRSVSPLRDGNIWQAYRHMVDLSVRDLNKAFDVYKTDPEEHPQYKDEWQKFWKRRKDELIAAGINHRSYNYQSEWILFFNARMEELYNQDVENIKIKCRERLCLPMTNNELADPKYHVNIPELEPEPEPQPEPEPDPQPQPKKTPTAMRENSVENRSKASENTEEVNVIHVLRLLTALENFLGSLGPSITEMLTKALQMSKTHPDKINKLILTNENCAILETAKEKFTGLIISKILDPNQERALKKAVSDTELLLDYAAEMSPFSSWTDDSANKAKEERLTLSSNTTAAFKTSESMGKSALAAKLASSLISQGKTSINQEQLKKIIQVYSLMEQKKHESSSPSRSSSVNTVNTTNSSTNSVPTPNELSMQGRNNNNTNSLAAAQAPNQQTYNQNYNQHGYTSLVPFMNSGVTNDLNSMKTSSSYFNANMARTNNTTNMNNNNNFNYNTNPRGWNYTNNGQQQQRMQQHQQLPPQQSQYTQGFDSGQFNQNANSSSQFTGSQNPSATHGNKSVWGQYNWMN